MSFSRGPQQAVATRQSPGAQTSAPRRVVFVATDYPPLAGTNTQRIQSLVRHLPDSGWEPWVVTRAIDDLPLIDPTELDRPEVRERVLRVADPDPFAWLARRHGRGAAELTPADQAKPEQSGPAAMPRSTLRSLARLPLSWGSTALKITLRYGAYHPDALRLWAGRTAREVIDRRRELAPAVIVTSHPAYSAHMAGLAIKRQTGLPWVADFRDLWVDRPYRQQASRFHAAIDRRCEAAVVSQCDFIVLASPAWPDRLAQRYGDGIRRKLCVITNGFEAAPASVDATSLWPATARLRLAWTGAMFDSESPADLVEALGRMAASTPETLAGLCVQLAGYGGEHEQRMRERAAALGLGGVLRFIGPQPHARARALQQSADGLLLALGPGHKETLQGKLFEYLAAERPILAMHPAGSEGAAILRRARAGEVVEYGDVAATEAVLRRWLSQGPPGIAPDRDYIAQFDRAALSRRFAAVLDQAIARRAVDAAAVIGASA
ncbi:MAG: glycosyltransferase [Burkholderiaceae bacterium]